MDLVQIFRQLQNLTIAESLSIVFLLCIPIFFFKRLKNTSKLNLPPSPPKLPIIGNLHQLGTLPHRSLQALSRKYGPIMLMQLGQTPTLVLSSAHLVEEMTKDHDIAFSNRHMTTAANIFVYNCTDVAFSPYGEYWRQVRKTCVVELLSLKRVHSFQYVRDQEVEASVDAIRHVSSNGGLVNLTELLGDVSNNIVSRCVLGKKSDREDDNRFGELSRKVAMHFVSFSFGDFFPCLGWLDFVTGLISGFKETFSQFDSFLDQVIEEHNNVSNKDNTFEMDFIHILLRSQKDDTLNFDLTQDKLKAILMDMFGGGIGTTSTMTEWTMAELLKNPATLKKVQEEVRKVVGKKSKIDENLDVHQMGYLKCVIKESLRLHPPLAISLPRETSVEVKLGGYDIPSKTNVFVNTWAIQRDPQQWDMPEEFIPERFEINKTIDYKGQDFQYIPFGMGRRGCPGISFGVATAEYTLANILHWFDWESPSGVSLGNLDMSEVNGLTVHKKNPLILEPTMYSP